MKCESCNEREATVHYTEINGAEKREIHLCEECYRQRLTPVQKTVDFAELLKGLLHGTVKEQGEAANAICPTCGISLVEFRSGGRLGCPNDYHIFGEVVGVLIEKLQHGNRHVGKVPSRAGAELKRENSLIRLRRDLERAVQREEYEVAASLRDRIHRITGSENGSDGTP